MYKYYYFLATHGSGQLLKNTTIKALNPFAAVFYGNYNVETF